MKKEKGKERITMRAKKLFAVAMTAALVLSMNMSVFANEGGKWTVAGPADDTSATTTCTNGLKWFQSDSTNYVYQVWSQNGTSEAYGITQNVTITEAGDYTLTMNIMGGSGDGITVTPVIGDQTGAGIATTGWNEDVTSWQTVTFTATLDAGTYDVGCTIDASASNAWGYVDNVSLTDASGNEVLNKGDFEISEDEWSTYVNDGSSDGTEETTAAQTNDTTAAAAENTTAASSTVATTGDATPWAMAVLAIAAASVVVVLRKKEVSE
jgi:hypothetical protein